jgi:hypothetical protein
MKKTKPVLLRLGPILFALCLALQGGPLGAADFGVLLNQELFFQGQKPVDFVTWKGSIIPWFSTFLGDNADLYVSAGISGTGENKELTFVPELFRAEFDFRFGQGSSVKAGRIPYTDPLGFIANGLFDGLQFHQDIGGGSMNIGAWYTGLLHRQSTGIIMDGVDGRGSRGDTTEYSQSLDYGNFYNTYFASKRVLAALGFDHPAFAGLVRVRTAIIGQFDLNRLDSDDDDKGNDVGRTDRIHSQYFTGKVSVPVTSRFIIEGGGALELAEDNQLQTRIAGAAEVGFSLLSMSAFRDRFTLLGRVGSGNPNDNAFTPFTPVTTQGQGNILLARLSGISLVQAEYTARLLDPLSIDISTIFFFKDPDTPYLANQHFTVESGYFLGNEIYWQFIWSPASDVTINMSTGAFIPRNNSDPVWKFGLNASLAIY